MDKIENYKKIFDERQHILSIYYVDSEMSISAARIIGDLLDEIERLTEELEKSQVILENMTGGQDPDEALNI